MELFLRKYGTMTFTLLVSRLVANVPATDNMKAVIAELEVATQMLEAALDEAADAIPSLNPIPKESI